MQTYIYRIKFTEFSQINSFISQQYFLKNGLTSSSRDHIILFIHMKKKKKLWCLIIRFVVFDRYHILFFGEYLGVPSWKFCCSILTNKHIIILRNVLFLRGVKTIATNLWDLTPKKKPILIHVFSVTLIMLWTKKKHIIHNHTCHCFQEYIYIYTPVIFFKNIYQSFKK